MGKILSCFFIKKMCPDYIDGLLGKQGRESITKHLELCGECQAYYDDSLFAREAVSLIEPVEPPKELKGMIMKRVKEFQQRKTGMVIKKMIPLAASIAVILTGTTAAGYMYVKKQDNDLLPAYTMRNFRVSDELRIFIEGQYYEPKEKITGSDSMIASNDSIPELKNGDNTSVAIRTGNGLENSVNRTQSIAGNNTNESNVVIEDDKNNTQDSGKNSAENKYFDNVMDAVADIYRTAKIGENAKMSSETDNIDEYNRINPVEPIILADEVPENTGTEVIEEETEKKTGKPETVQESTYLKPR